MTETHPYIKFVPEGAQYLIIGSFPAVNSGDWFYGSPRNQFWKILENVYKKDLNSLGSKKQLFTVLNIAITDIFLKVKRKKGTSLDNQLKILEYNSEAINELLISNEISCIYFTSKFVEKQFKKLYIDKEIKHKLITLPSPSPRYAAMRFEEKCKIYRKLLP